MRFLRINTGERSYAVEEVELGGDILGVVDYGVKLHFEVYRSYEADPFSPRNILVAGCGPFAGSPVFGGHRMVFVFRSPQTLGLHVSTLGGACYQFVRTGVNGFIVEGWSEEPLLISVSGDGGSVRVEFMEVGWDRLWSIWRGYRGLRGTEALTAYALEKVEPRPDRVLVVGPAAARTIFGGVFSYVVEGGGVGPVVDSASRGGAGSVMLRAHGVAAVAFRGTAPRRGLLELRDLEEASRRVLGQPYAAAAASATVKYRFDPKLGTGGTFGVNYVHYRELLPFFGYNTVYLSRAARLRILSLILEHLWRPVQAEVFEAEGGKPWRTCGEPCPAACKKVWRGVKVDYEPSNALGGLIGVVKAEHVARLIRLVDELGIDAIEAGHIISWLFDLLHRGMLQPREVGVSGRPHFDPLTYTAEHSEANAKLAAEILEGLVEHGSELLKMVALEGARAAARMLDEKFKSRVRMYGLSYRDLLVYAAYGEKGYMTPNLYWAPGLVAPLPLPGRYWSVYSPTLPRDPRELAGMIRARMVNEYLVDNAGLCRFHRRWAEKLLDELYGRILGSKVDLGEHARRILGLIAEYRVRAGAEPRPWESRKTIDMMVSLAYELGDSELAEKLYQNPAWYWEELREALWSWLLSREAGRAVQPPQGQGG
jgi:glyceraldehyde-3-phosphate dehydrogenase (ferredoxin)